MAMLNTQMVIIPYENYETNWCHVGMYEGPLHCETPLTFETVSSEILNYST